MISSSLQEIKIIKIQRKYTIGSNNLYVFIMIPRIGLVLHYETPKIKHQKQVLININIAKYAKDLFVIKLRSLPRNYRSIVDLVYQH